MLMNYFKVNGLRDLNIVFTMETTIIILSCREIDSDVIGWPAVSWNIGHYLRV